MICFLVLLSPLQEDKKEGKKFVVFMKEIKKYLSYE
jgi:hypothetical protein